MESMLVSLLSSSLCLPTTVFNSLRLLVNTTSTATMINWSHMFLLELILVTVLVVMVEMVIMIRSRYSLLINISRLRLLQVEL